MKLLLNAAPSLSSRWVGGWGGGGGNRGMIPVIREWVVNGERGPRKKRTQRGIIKKVESMRYKKRISQYCARKRQKGLIYAGTTTTFHPTSARFYIGNALFSAVASYFFVRAGKWREMKSKRAEPGENVNESTREDPGC